MLKLTRFLTNVVKLTGPQCTYMCRCWKYGIGQFILSWSVRVFLLGDAHVEALTGIETSNSGEIVISRAYAYLHGVMIWRQTKRRLI